MEGLVKGVTAEGGGGGRLKLSNTGLSLAPSGSGGVPMGGLSVVVVSDSVVGRVGDVLADSSLLCV